MAQDAMLRRRLFLSTTIFLGGTMTQFQTVYLLRCQDAEGSALRRKEHLAAHLEWAKRQTQILLAGPLRDEAGTMHGSLYLIHANDRDAAAKWLSDDPYFLAGVWQSVDVNTWQVVMGAWLPETIGIHHG
jgi:uncharacterized protein